MNESLVTIRYVKALYELAKEQKSLESVVSDIRNLIEIMAESGEFNELLVNPIIKSSEKNRLTDQLFSSQMNPLTVRFLHLLVDNKREKHLKNLCLYFVRYYKTQQGIKEAVITTARTLSPSHRNEITQYITKKFKMEIELEEKVDPSIIGGFILRIGDQQINASLNYQLSKIRRELIHT